jgi:hypothetical protein
MGLLPMTLRHTLLTRLGELGCDVWTLARIAGHSSIAMSSRCVHPSQDRVLDAMALLGGTILGTLKKMHRRRKWFRLQQVVKFQRLKWWAVQDSNLRPPACKAGALTS